MRATPKALLLLLATILAAATSAVAAGVPAGSPLLSLDSETTAPLALARAAQASETGALLRIARLRDAAGAPLTLALERGRLFAPDFKLYLDGRDTPTDAPQRLVYLHGTAEEWPGSSVAIVVDAATGGWNGSMVRADGVFELALAAGTDESTVAAAAAVQRADLTGLAGGMLDDGLHMPAGERRTAVAAAAKRIIPAPGGIYGAGVAVETDHEFLDRRTVEEATKLVVDTIAGVSELYERQLGVPLVITSLALYPDPDDPWNAPEPHSGANAEVLCEFGRFWQAHRPLAAYPRNAALFFTGKRSFEIGGQAWLSSLCSYSARQSSCPSGGYGVVVSSFLGRNVLVTAHELGHIFGSPHTHCFRPEIDRCAGQAGCYAGPLSEPAEGGSVMSYCGNVNLSMGEPGLYGNGSERVIGVIRGLVDRVAPTCLGRVNDPYELAGVAAGNTATLTWVDPFGNETGWSVEQLVKGKWKLVKALPANSTTVTIGKLKPGVASFRVRAKIKKDVSDYSAVVELTAE